MKKEREREKKEVEISVVQCSLFSFDLIDEEVDICWDVIGADQLLDFFHAVLDRILMAEAVSVSVSSFILATSSVVDEEFLALVVDAAAQIALKP